MYILTFIINTNAVNVTLCCAKVDLMLKASEGEGTTTRG